MLVEIIILLLPADVLVMFYKKEYSIGSCMFAAVFVGVVSGWLEVRWCSAAVLQSVWCGGPPVTRRD